ncbi:MAG: 30S ribosomal protein S7 [Bacteroidetes bacterium CG23_combo_of_CG06-09_8_20_14_all_32_9]|nr:MAG: 30S ribosomal protein S7 [Bacteroidetes bacterium CG23_combo_of_CG06-09_8_20_14_all_32_9]
MRKSRLKKRIILPDSKFNDILVSKFVNKLLYEGKKNIALKLFYDAMEVVATKTKESGLEPLDYWKKALENITPNVEVKSRRVGGATFQVPTEIRQERKVAISIKNLIEFARKRNGRTMSEKLAAEIIAAYNSEGGAFKRKEDIHKMAEANKAFSHFRF